MPLAVLERALPSFAPLPLHLVRGHHRDQHLEVGVREIGADLPETLRYVLANCLLMDGMSRRHAGLAEDVLY